MSVLTFPLDLEYQMNNICALILRENLFPPSMTNPEHIIPKRSKKRKKSPNSFFIFKMNLHKEIKRNKLKIKMSLESKLASKYWNDANQLEKNYYKELAKQVKLYFQTTLSTCLKPENETNQNYLIQSLNDNNNLYTSQVHYTPYDFYYLDFNFVNSIQNINSIIPYNT